MYPALQPGKSDPLFQEKVLAQTCFDAMRATGTCSLSPSQVTPELLMVLVGQVSVHYQLRTDRMQPVYGAPFDPSPWLTPAKLLPQEPAEAWQHVRQYPTWRVWRQVLAHAWALNPDKPSLPLLAQLVRAGELRLLQDVQTKPGLGIRWKWCHTQAEELMASMSSRDALPVPLGLALGRWLAEVAPPPGPRASVKTTSVWVRALTRFKDNTLPLRKADNEAWLLGWWEVFKGLGEHPDAAPYPSSHQNQGLQVALNHEQWAVAKQLILDGADVNAYIPTKGHPLLGVMQNVRSEPLKPLDEGLVEIMFAMFDRGLNWHMENPFPGIRSFKAFLPEESQMHHIEERWRAYCLEQSMDAAPSAGQRLRF